MADPRIVPVPVEITSPVFVAISRWPFEDEFVSRVLTEDIPQRVTFSLGRVFAYEDSENNLVGFGTLDVCKDYAALTADRWHTYIPLLAVHPHHLRKGYGRAILEHLVSEAAFVASALSELVDPAVFLDVYEQSTAAHGLYLKCGFTDLTHQPLVDSANGMRYRVMAKRVV